MLYWEYHRLGIPLISERCLLQRISCSGRFRARAEAIHPPSTPVRLWRGQDSIAGRMSEVIHACSNAEHALQSSAKYHTHEASQKYKASIYLYFQAKSLILNPLSLQDHSAAVRTQMNFPYLLYPKIATEQSILTSQTNLFNVSYVHFDGETAATLAVGAREKGEAAKLAPQ